jgi:hypothetical protein
MKSTPQKWGVLSFIQILDFSRYVVRRMSVAQASKALGLKPSPSGLALGHLPHSICRTMHMHGAASPHLLSG